MNKRDDFSQKTIDTLCERVGGKCSNPKCITNTEQELGQSFKLVDKEYDIHRCVYCEKKIK